LRDLGDLGIEGLMNYDNSLIEVWKWKERVYEDTKGMSVKEVPFATRNSRDKNEKNEKN
jgi:hypothetical protein